MFYTHETQQGWCSVGLLIINEFKIKINLIVHNNTRVKQGPRYYVCGQVVYYTAAYDYCIITI